MVSNLLRTSCNWLASQDMHKSKCQCRGSVHALPPGYPPYSQTEVGTRFFFFRCSRLSKRPYRVIFGPLAVALFPGISADLPLPLLSNKKDGLIGKERNNLHHPPLKAMTPDCYSNYTGIYETLGLELGYRRIFKTIPH